jgi:prephenate dehydratase
LPKIGNEVRHDLYYQYEELGSKDTGETHRQALPRCSCVVRAHSASRVYDSCSSTGRTAVFRNRMFSISTATENAMAE